MPAIPLSHFPAAFRPTCHKCGSNRLHFNFTHHAWMWTKMEIQYSCSTCGVTGYGEETVISRFSPQLDAWRKVQHNAQKMQEAQALAQREAERCAAQEIASAEAAVALQAQISEQNLVAEKQRADEEIQRRQNQLRENNRKRDREYRERKKLRLAEAALRAERQEAEAKALAEMPTTPRCAWQECSNARTASSKYCSCLCSNRNAAHNERLRRAQRTLRGPAPLEQGDGAQ